MKPNREPLISVVLPTYNVAQYLRQCLESVAAQTYRNIEVIIIIDGATDSSYEIAQDFCKTDNRFSVYWQENAGSGPARNNGLAHCQGEFVMFVDPDDWIEPELLEKFRTADVLDLGTGGGFPGISLAILFPEARFVLCDSVGKKTIVAQAVASALNLKNVQVVNARAESLPQRFNFVVSRAVASLTDFYPWVKGKFTDGILYLKGGDVVEEIAEVMSRHRLPKGSVHTWPVSSWLHDSYYEGKLVIFIEK